ncbi:MAG: hypothetical protein ACYDAN_07330 [Candidatus Limnocylindrales bacterium]
MSDQPTPALDEASLAENRAGRLSDSQRQRLSSMARAGRKNELAGTLVLGMVAAVMFIGRGPANEATQRLLIGAACVIGAIVFLVRGLTGADALSRDLGDTHIDRVEGAVEREEVRVTSGRSSAAPTLYLAVGGRRYHAFRDAYDAAPEAGYLALFVLRHSGRVVNFERLPDPALPAGALDHPVDLIHTLAPIMRSHDQVVRAEARAEFEQLAGAEKARVEANMVRGAVAPPPDQRDQRPLAASLPGTWAGAGAKAEFRTDGTAVMTWFGREMAGRWSVDPRGQLHLGLGGRDQAVEAWIADDTLTVTMDGTGFSFQRSPG